MHTVPLPATFMEEYDHTVNGMDDVIPACLPTGGFLPPSPYDTNPCGEYGCRMLSLLFQGTTFLPSSPDNRMILRAPRLAEEVQATETLERSRVAHVVSERRRAYVRNTRASQCAASALARETLSVLATSHSCPRTRDMPARWDRRAQPQRSPRPVSMLAVVDGDYGSDEEEDLGASLSGLQTPTLTTDSGSDIESVGALTPAHVACPLGFTSHKDTLLDLRVDGPCPTGRRVLARNTSLEALPLPNLAVPFAQQQGRRGGA